MKTWSKLINKLIILTLPIIVTSCSGNTSNSEDENEKLISEFEENPVTNVFEGDSLTNEFDDGPLTTESEEGIIQLTEQYNPISVDMLKSLQSNNELYSKLKLHYPQIAQKERVVNNLLLKQTLFAVKTECFGGQDLLWTARRDSVIAWIVDVALEQMDVDRPKEYFTVDVLYNYIEEHSKKVENYDNNLMSEISNSLDSCRKHWKED